MDFGREVENAEHFHAVWRYCVFVVNGADVAEAECFDQSLYDFVMRVQGGEWQWKEGVGTRASSSRLMVRVWYPMSVLVSDIVKCLFLSLLDGSRESGGSQGRSGAECSFSLDPVASMGRQARQKVY